MRGFVALVVLAASAACGSPPLPAAADPVAAPRSVASSSAPSPSAPPSSSSSSSPGSTAARRPLPGLVPLASWVGDAKPDGSPPWGAAFDDRSIVLLGESLHLTREFPQVRLPLVRDLHERLGFDVIAVEGSMIDAWLAQDDLLREPDAADAVERASRDGWLTIWNTAEMRAVLAYAHGQRAHAPLYFASMDIQPGMGGTELKKAVMRRFFERVLDYRGAKDAAARAEAWAKTLEPMRKCAGPQPPPPEHARAVGEVSAAIRAADSAVRKRSPIHADTLALVPRMLEQRLSHCREAGLSTGPDGKFDQGMYWRTYKSVRDRHQAENVLALRDRVSRSHRVVVWAHHSHVAYEAAGSSAKVSIAGVLREKVPDQTYALGVFGGGGRFTRFLDGPRSGFVPTDVPPAGAPGFDGIDALRSLDASASGYFLDLRASKGDPRAAFAGEPHGYPLEGEPRSIALAANFDGLIFVPRVSEPTVDEPISSTGRTSSAAGHVVPRTTGVTRSSP